MIRRIVNTIIISVIALAAKAQTDSIVAPADTLPPLSGNWIQQLMQVNYRINDPRIRYPKFANFCRKVYNWGDHTFNTYDPNYVVGNGKNWKTYIKSYNWLQTYAYLFGMFNHDNAIRLHTKMNSDLGVSLNFMAVSIGYTWNVNRWMSNVRDDRSSFNFAFTCSLFSAELMTWRSRGDGYLTKFGNYQAPGNQKFSFLLPGGVDQSAFNINAYYFFNNKKYSQSAAYHYSKYQKRSAGTWLIGLSFNQQKINIDFSSLPEDVRLAVPELPLKNHYEYQDYNLMGGYAYNCVMPHNWLYNITVLPSFGYKRSHLVEKGTKEMLAANMQMKMSMTYNHRALFASGIIRFDGGLIFKKDYAFFNAMESVTILVGMRF